MFKIGIDHFFMLYTAVAVGAFLFLWLRQLWQESTYEWNISQEQLINCRKCSMTFISGRTGISVVCPSCNEEFRLKLKKSAKRIRY